MGCMNCSRVNREEACITEASDLLGFRNKHAKEVDSIIRKYSSDIVINDQQFTALAKHLQLAVNTRTAPLFERLRESNGNYDRRSLIVLGVLLSSGLSGEKAKVLFEAYDNEHSSVISVQEVDAMLDAMTSIAAALLPELVTADSEVKAYSLAIQGSSPELKQEIKRDSVEGDTVKKHRFIMSMSQLHGGQLVHAGGLRSYLYVLSKKKAKAALQQHND